jgi:hypothetical protein
MGNHQQEADKGGLKSKSEPYSEPNSQPKAENTTLGPND